MAQSGGFQVVDRGDGYDDLKVSLSAALGDQRRARKSSDVQGDRLPPTLPSPILYGPWHDDLIDVVGIADGQTVPVWSRWQQL
jgi:hypothetical protein